MMISLRIRRQRPSSTCQNENELIRTGMVAYSIPKMMYTLIVIFFVIVLQLLEEVHYNKSAVVATAFHVPLPFHKSTTRGNSNNHHNYNNLPYISSWRNHQHPQQHRHHDDARRRGVVVVLHAKAVAIKNDPWFPRRKTQFENDDITASIIEERAVLLAAELVQRRILRKQQQANNNNDNNNSTATAAAAAAAAEVSSTTYVKMSDEQRQKIQTLVNNRFMDLACTTAGQRSLEMLFLEDGNDLLVDYLDDKENDDSVFHNKEDIIRGAIMVFQSLCIFAMQVGVKGTPEQLKRMVSHLDDRRDPTLIQRDLYTIWDYDSVRRLKFRRSNTAAIQLLAVVQKWRRTSQGAFDLLVALNVWQVHEDIALLRSGFPLSFSIEEEMAAQKVANSSAVIGPSSTTIPDPDDILGLRQDLTHLKVYTIDSASTSEIDDGLSLEKVIVEEKSEDGTSTTTTRIRHRLWVHIADADHWAPRGSSLFEAARKRITSLYLPTNHISMFPSSASTQIMSLRVANRGGNGGHGDVLALSLGVMLDEHGAIDPSSIIVTPSKIRVTYRLTYDEVDELLEEGTGCREEWQLGAMLDMATLRRAHRIEMGSSEGLIPNPIPYSSVNVRDNKVNGAEPDISIMVEMSHNAGKNKTTEVCLEEEHVDSNGAVLDVAPVSSSNLLVTEAMILACEALPRWKLLMDETDALAAEEKHDDDHNMLSVPRRLPNQLRLPFRTQPKPDFKSRARERRVLESLREYNVGNGLCYAWYIRRFLEPVKISETPSPHSGLGLDCYVQWSSPIRRFSDLQVHASVKRYLRRKRIQHLVLQKEEESISTLPDGIEPSHLGWPEDVLVDKENGGLANVKLTTSDLDQDMDFLEGIGLVGASRTIQRQSQQYWMFEYIRRLQQKRSNMKSDNKNGNNKVMFRAIVLGCIDPERQQYAIYVPELGLEHRYVSPIRLDPGAKLNLTVDSVFPRTGLLTFVRVM